MTPDPLPEPFVPPEADVRGFPYTPLFRSRLFGSEFHAHADDASWRAGVTLWLKSWDQVPAGSLPADEISLCRLAELGRDLKSWAKVREWALYGWVRCSDGRLYHKVVAEGVLEAWQSRQAQRDRTVAAREARMRQRQQQAQQESEIQSVLQPLSQTSVTEVVTSSNRTEQNRTERTPPPLVPPPPPPPKHRKVAR